MSPQSFTTPIIHHIHYRDLEWWDEGKEGQEDEEGEKAGGCWRRATARLYVKMGGFLLVEKGDALKVIEEEEKGEDEGGAIKTMSKSLRYVVVPTSTSCIDPSYIGQTL